jgi:hypothetical protein
MSKFLLIVAIATLSSFAAATPTTTGAEDAEYKNYWGRGGWTRCSGCYR